MTLLRLAYAPHEQLDLMLSLVGCICHPSAHDVPDENQRQWCLHLSKALRADVLLADGEDPLALLRAWILFPVWQRLKLRFARERVYALETTPWQNADTPGRLDTLWQAVVWRATTALGSELESPPMEN